MNINSHVEHRLCSKKHSANEIKKRIFEGKIIIFKESPAILKIKKIYRFHLKEFFPKKISFMSSNIHDQNKKMLSFQKKIKNCNLIRLEFLRFLENLNFDKSDIFCDKITLRYSPKKKELNFGSLKPIGAHRDTWASNIYHQINWWIPLQHVKEDSSIFIAPAYFKKKICNNSYFWSFDKFKRRKETLSSPIAKIQIKESKKIKFNLNFGEVLCFSGNHLHGSLVGSKSRLNLETRTISSKDPKNFQIPKNIDSENTEIKYSWFRSLIDGSNYPVE